MIFNGSSARKPIGTASVELVFDNSDGKIGGAYASYNEISLKRSVSRDGTSAYFINGGRCRRKDITHLFLGTGLGSRSYAIIEQGMISRVIEARHDDMRAFIEEAAGDFAVQGAPPRDRDAASPTRARIWRVCRICATRSTSRSATCSARPTSRGAIRNSRRQERTLTAELLALRLRELDSGAAVQDSAVRELRAGRCSRHWRSSARRKRRSRSSANATPS